MGNTNRKENENDDGLNKPKYHHIGPVNVIPLQSSEPNRNVKHGSRSDLQSLPSLHNPNHKKNPLILRRPSGKRDPQKLTSSIIPDQHTLTFSIQNDPSTTVASQSSSSKADPRKFYPSFLSTSTGLRRTSSVFSKVPVDPENHINEKKSQTLEFTNQPGKRWYDHNYENKLQSTDTDNL